MQKSNAEERLVWPYLNMRECKAARRDDTVTLEIPTPFVCTFCTLKSQLHAADRFRSGKYEALLSRIIKSNRVNLTTFLNIVLKTRPNYCVSFVLLAIMFRNCYVALVCHSFSLFKQQMIFGLNPLY